MAHASADRPPVARRGDGALVALRTTRIADLEPRNIFVADAAAIAPSYKPAPGRNDIGLLRLEKAVRRLRGRRRQRLHARQALRPWIERVTGLPDRR